MVFSFPRLSAFSFGLWFWAGMLFGMIFSIPLIGRDLGIMLAWESAAGERAWLGWWASVASRSFVGGNNLGAQDISHLIMGIVLIGYVLSYWNRLGALQSVLRVWFGYWLACLLCFFAVNRGMKVFFGRVRPSDVLRGEIDYTLTGPLSQYELVDALSKGSFTSGHTTMAMVLLPLAFLALGRAWKNAHILFILALGWGLMVGWGRVINGSHYPSDILWAAVVCIWICAYVQKRLLQLHVSPDARTGPPFGGVVLAAWFALGLFLVFFTATGIKETLFRFVWWWPAATAASGISAWFCLRRAVVIRRRCGLVAGSG